MVVPLIDEVFSPMKLLLLLTELSGIGLCGRELMVPFDLLVVRLCKLEADWLSCTDDGGVDVSLYCEFSVEDDLFSVWAAPLDSELFDPLLGTFIPSTLELVFFRRSSLKKGIACAWQRWSCKER